MGEPGAYVAMTQHLVIDHDFGGDGDWAVDVAATLAALDAAGWSLVPSEQAVEIERLRGALEKIADADPLKPSRMIAAARSTLDTDQPPSRGRCFWCSTTADECDAARVEQRKCCPDCRHDPTVQPPRGDEPRREA